MMRSTVSNPARSIEQVQSCVDAVHADGESVEAWTAPRRASQTTTMMLPRRISFKHDENSS
jgi:hypothetical protein